MLLDTGEHGGTAVFAICRSQDKAFVLEDRFNKAVGVPGNPALACILRGKHGSLRRVSPDNETSFTINAFSMTAGEYGRLLAETMRMRGIARLSGWSPGDGDNPNCLTANFFNIHERPQLSSFKPKWSLAGKPFTIFLLSS